MLVLIAAAAAGAFASMRVQRFGTLGTEVHSAHNVTTNKHCKCQLSPIYEETLSFVNNNGAVITQFEVMPGDKYGFGMVIGNNTTFNVLYTLACLDLAAHKAEDAPRMIFVVGAKRAADPQIKYVGFDGANGTSTVVPWVGIDYKLVFP